MEGTHLNSKKSDIWSSAVPDVTLTGRHLAAARSVLERSVDTSEIRLAFVSGSLAAGLGHAFSDIDVYVATSSGNFIRQRDYIEDGLVVQINPLSDRELELISRASGEYVATARDRWQLELPEEDLKRVVRYALGTVLADETSCLPPVGQAWDVSRRILMTGSAYYIGGLAEDALGALQIGDHLTAVKASEIALENALECSLAGAGDIYVGSKFSLRRAARSKALKDILDDLWMLLSNPETQADCLDHVVNRMFFVSHLVANSMLLGWERPMARMPKYVNRHCSGEVTRSPWAIPVRLSDSWGMVAPDSGFRVNAKTVLLWLLLDGRSIDSLPDAMARYDVGEVPSQTNLIRAIDQLEEKNVAVSGSAWLGVKGGKNA